MELRGLKPNAVIHAPKSLIESVSKKSNSAAIRSHSL
jgi:hypothetical protein